jgi:glycosyltransferase involved in cell wall biosynthesis
MSVLVPAYNEASGLAASLTSIREASAAFESRGWTTELIVCDNNSTDDTAAIARAHGATVVFEPVNQIGRARNAAAARASGDWFVFVDADSSPSAPLFEDVARTVLGGRCLAGGSAVEMDDGAWAASAMVGLWNLISRSTGWAAGSFMFVEAGAFRAVGGFSRDLYATEELDLFRRLKRLARRQGRQVVILTAHPLKTSARKLQLYSWREIAGFMLRTVLSGGRTLRRADECAVWYDGRR